MELQCINRLEQALVAAFPAAKLPEGTHLSAELCPPGMEGDITVNCFRMTRFFATKPDVLAAKAAGAEACLVSRVEAETAADYQIRELEELYALIGLEKE